MSRWKVTVVGGYADGDATRPGLSVHILDRRVNHRIVATFRSEDYGGGGAFHAAATRLADLIERVER